MRAFFDSNVLLKYLFGVDEAKRLVEGVLSGELDGFINDIVVSEVVYGYLRLALNLPRHEIRRYTRDDPHGIGEMLARDVTPLLNRFDVLATHVAIDELVEAMRLGLLPNDALIAVTCRHYGIGVIATFDEDFRRVPWLRVIP